MKKRYTGLFILMVSLAACQNRNTSNTTEDSSTVQTDTSQIKNDTLSYAYDSVKVYSKNPLSASKSVTDTAKAVISYPVFKDTALNNFIQKKVISLSVTENAPAENTYKEMATSFINGFDTFQEQNKDRIQTWFLDAGLKVLKQIPGYLPAKYTYVNFSGGAHPNSSFTYFNYDLNKKEEISLESLLIPGSLAKLNTVAEKIFRKNEKLAPDASLKNNYFFENDVFKLNSNFTITNEGLKFLYNPYEIKAYVYGTTELLLPFSEIKDLLKSNTILSAANK